MIIEFRSNDLQMVMECNINASSVKYVYHKVPVKDIRNPGQSSKVHCAVIYIISKSYRYWHTKMQLTDVFPDGKVHGANMGPTWGRQDPGGPHIGPMNLASWVVMKNPDIVYYYFSMYKYLELILHEKSMYCGYPYPRRTYSRKDPVAPSIRSRRDIDWRTPLVVGTPLVLGVIVLQRKGARIL